MKDKFNHDQDDFIKALALDKDVLIGYVETGIKIHIQDKKPLSVSVLETIKLIKNGNPKIKKDDLEIMIFVSGMIFEQALKNIQSKMSILDLLPSMDPSNPMLSMLKKLQGTDSTDHTKDNLIESFLSDKTSNEKGPATKFLESIIGKEQLDDIVKRSLNKAGLDIKDLGRILHSDKQPDITQPFNTDDLIKSMQDDND